VPDRPLFQSLFSGLNVSFFFSTNGISPHAYVHHFRNTSAANHKHFLFGPTLQTMLRYFPFYCWKKNLRSSKPSRSWKKNITAPTKLTPIVSLQRETGFISQSRAMRLHPTTDMDTIDAYGLDIM
jgi:hypothetical protein